MLFGLRLLLQQSLRLAMNQEGGSDIVLAAGYDGLQLVSHLETNPRCITGLGCLLLYQVQEAIQSAIKAHVQNVGASRSSDQC